MLPLNRRKPFNRDRNPHFPFYRDVKLLNYAPNGLGDWLPATTDRNYERQGLPLIQAPHFITLCDNVPNTLYPHDTWFGLGVTILQPFVNQGMVELGNRTATGKVERATASLEK